ncbi:MAG: FecR family protein [Chitinophagaceae bacterium]|nr:FecR family protein [Chitinophagaceae bacterium]
MDNNQSRLWELLAKRLGDDVTAEEQAELEELLKDASAPLHDQDALRTLWATKMQNTRMELVDIDKQWENISQSLFPEKSHLYVTTLDDRPEPHKRFKRAWMYTAASLLIMACAGTSFYFYNLPNVISVPLKEEDRPNQVTSRNGSKTSVVLPEGTKVWLNAGSRIDYNNDFVGKREVYLTGEAFFDVKHNADDPFIIHAGNVNIKVLGTSFNVKAYADDDRVETALVKGSVELTTNDDPERKILLRPSEKITVLKVKRAAGAQADGDSGNKTAPKAELYSISRMIVDKRDSVLEDIAWMKERLIFKGETFSQLSKRMERWYGVTIFFADQASSLVRFTGEFDNQNIVQALDALQFSCNYKFRYSIDKSQIRISTK